MNAPTFLLPSTEYAQRCMCVCAIRGKREKPFASKTGGIRICGGSDRRRIEERRRSLRFAATQRSEVFGRRERRIGACESKRLTNAFGFAYNVNEKHIRQEYPAGNGQREGSAAESPLRGMREKCGRTAPRRKCRGGRRRYTHTRGGLLSAIKVGPR